MLLDNEPAHDNEDALDNHNHNNETNDHMADVPDDSQLLHPKKMRTKKQQRKALHKKVIATMRDMVLGGELDLLPKPKAKAPPAADSASPQRR